MLSAKLICFRMETTPLQRYAHCEGKTSTAVTAFHIGKIAKESCFNKIFPNLEIGVEKTAEGTLLNKIGCVNTVMFEKEIGQQSKNLR